MAGRIIYLEVDDEITSAAARIRDSDAPRIAVVLPYGSRVATSRINFRLLARDALTHDKRLSIVSGDPATRALAASAGLPVFASVAEYESSMAGRDDDGPRPGDRRSRSCRRPRSAAAPAIEPAEPAEPDAASDVGRGRRRSHRPNRSRTGRSGSSSRRRPSGRDVAVRPARPSAPRPRATRMPRATPARATDAPRPPAGPGPVAPRRDSRRGAAVSGRHGSSVARSSPWPCSSPAVGVVPAAAMRRRSRSRRGQNGRADPADGRGRHDCDPARPVAGVVPAEDDLDPGRSQRHVQRDRQAGRA